MTRTPSIPSVAMVTWLAVLMGGTVEAQSFRTVTAARTVLGEDSLHVQVEFAAGTMQLSPGDGRMLYQGEIYYDEDKFEPEVSYGTDSNSLTFSLETVGGGLKLGRIETPQRMDLYLAPQVPTTLAVELGAAEAWVELGGLSLASADIELGAADLYLSFSEPNRIDCKWLDLTVAAAEFRAVGLANARCEHVSFEGGVGDITLDFTGDWPEGITREAEVKLGLGQLTLRLPRQLGVAIEMDRFIASFDRSGFRKRGPRYLSYNYEQASARLHISLKAVLGDIDIEWVRH